MADEYVTKSTEILDGKSKLNPAEEVFVLSAAATALKRQAAMRSKALTKNADGSAYSVSVPVFPSHAAHRIDGRRRKRDTGRTEQFNIKVTPALKENVVSACQAHRLNITDFAEQAFEALLKQLSG